jgi:hypothetical protein
MTLRQYYRAALLFPLIPPVISGLVLYATYPSRRGAADWAGTVVFVSAFGLIPYIPSAILFFLWETRNPITSRDYGRVLILFPLGAAAVGVLIFLAVKGLGGSFGHGLLEASFFAGMTIIGGYFYAAIIWVIGAICRYYGYITPEPNQE